MAVVTSSSTPVLPAAARGRTAAGVTGYARLAWIVLAFNLGVILWGAFVRATGSGAGCGNHWPLCNGAVVPRSPGVETLIELGHRTTSGLALLLVAALVIGARRRFPRGHAVRWAAAASGFFIVTEALIGAGLVLLELVADNASVARGFWVAGHLVNTFLLVAALALTAWWAAIGPPARRPGAALASLGGVALGGVLLLSVSGAVTALGDTLFPAASLAEAKAQTFSETAHVFIRLRIWHPALALGVGVLVLAVVVHVARRVATPAARRLGGALIVLYAAQLGIGLLNVSHLAPVPLQIVHLFLSDLIWIALVLLAAAALAPAPATARLAAPVTGPLT